ncbi:putative cut9 interacting protein [Rosellinia necatrix]|uniref:Putative cut9 interacting protein n=1 Tax=Rosellinia necatrix TaxID=77044 RepID=A0A1W2TXL5_ROSNE|nr:putative cut9 interacting protein [Rosellinia necatrix]
MKTRVLTVMATRSQDQDLVYEVASRHGVHTGKAISSSSPAPIDQGRIVPSFGWHPWFSYQLYDDTDPDATYDGTAAGKIAHYDKVLSPTPSSKDVSFSNGLSDPRPLSEFLEETRKRLEQFPLALVGEIGLDKAFRLPTAWKSTEEASRGEGLTPGGREGRQLSPYRVRITHQTTILRAQLELAGRMGRPVSVHGVQAHGALYDVIAGCWKGYEKEVLSRRQKRQIAEGAEDFLDDTDEDSDYGSTANRKDDVQKPAADNGKGAGPQPFPPRICLHSYSGPVEQLKMYIHPSVPAKVYFSFATAINWGSGGVEKTEEAIRAIPNDRLLVESDLHTAGEQLDSSVEDVCRKICRIKGWGLREGVETLGRNWRGFVFG